MVAPAVTPGATTQRAVGNQHTRPARKATALSESMNMGIGGSRSGTGGLTQ